MNKVEAELVDTGFAFRSNAVLTQVMWEAGKLTVTLTAQGDQTVRVHFSDLAGFRVLDEGNLMEFWPTCAMGRGLLFDIKKHGWLDFEITRPGFVTGQCAQVHEYLLAGINECINVLTWAEPSVEILSA